MNDTERITVGDTLIPLRRQLCDADGQPIDISADTITFSMAGTISGTAKVTAGSCTVKQIGDGILPITGITAADPPSVTATSHGIATGDMIYLDGANMLGMDELKGRHFQITSTGANTFTLDGENATQHAAYSSGGTAVTRGFVQYAWQTADVDTAGSYFGQFKRTVSAQTEHIPIAESFRIDIVAKVV